LNREIHVFLWRNHKNMNHAFRLVNPVYDMDTYIFKVNVFAKQAKHESNTVLFSSLRVFNMQGWVPIDSPCECEHNNPDSFVISVICVSPVPTGWVSRW